MRNFQLGIMIEQDGNPMTRDYSRINPSTDSPHNENVITLQRNLGMRGIQYRGTRGV